MSSTGPICSACVDNFGARPVTFFSGVMVAGGLMLSAFAPNVPFLMFSYGIVVGKEVLHDSKVPGSGPNIMEPKKLKYGLGSY